VFAFVSLVQQTEVLDTVLYIVIKWIKWNEVLRNTKVSTYSVCVYGFLFFYEFSNVAYSA
jgi:hypothetical protein